MKFLTIDRAASLLGLDGTTLNTWIANGWLHTSRQQDGTTKISTDDILRCVREHGVTLESDTTISVIWLEQLITTLQTQVTELQGQITDLTTRVTALEEA